jgi:outer membrane protein OmpA-like peptidoglycan-associated protein
MMRVLSLPALGVTLLLASALAGCSSRVPPRPVPPPEAKPQLPPWYPEKPWDAKGEDERVYFEGKIVFDTAKSTIRPESRAVLSRLLAWLQDNPDVSRIRLEGHTDSRASEEYNQGLSERRAVAVADWLVDNGLDHTRLLAVAFGELRPLADNDSAVGRQENRRTSFHVAEVGGYRFRDEDPSNGGLVLTVLSREERDEMKKKAEVPVYVPPPVVAERDIIKPVKRPQKDPADAETLPPPAPEPPPDAAPAQ